MPSYDSLFIVYNNTPSITQNPVSLLREHGVNQKTKSMPILSTYEDTPFSLK